MSPVPSTPTLAKSQVTPERTSDANSAVVDFDLLAKLVCKSSSDIPKVSEALQRAFMDLDISDWRDVSLFHLKIFCLRVISFRRNVVPCSHQSSCVIN